MSEAARRTEVAVLILLAFGAFARAEEFRSAWPEDAERVWAGPEYWTNRLQDWRVARGRLECVTSGPDRGVHLLTRELVEGHVAGRGEFHMSVRLGVLGKADTGQARGWAGFRVGIRGGFRDYRDSVRRGKGLDAGVTTDGELFIGSTGGAGTLVPRGGIPRDKWRIKYVDSEETEGEDSRARNVFDGRANTIWHSRWRRNKAHYPHEIQIDLGGIHKVSGFCYLPRQKVAVGRIRDYEFYLSGDGKSWGEALAAGRFENSAELQEVRFKEKRGRYVRLLARSDFLGRPACVIAELYVLSAAFPGRRDQKEHEPPRALPLGDIELRLRAEPDGERYRLTLSAHQPKSGERLAQLTHDGVPAGKLVGGVALLCHSKPARRGKKGGNARFWFRDWRTGGSKVAAHDERAFGPILWAQHTLSDGVLKMTAQMPPVGEKDAQSVRLEIKGEGGVWITLGEAKIEKLARTATFRIGNWDASRDTPYRLAYALTGTAGEVRDHYWSGTIRRDPVDKDVIVVAAFTGNADYAFPNNDILRHVAAHDPDVLFFSGDNIYENVGGYGCQRSPLDKSILGYLRKWYFYGWAFGDLMRDRPCVSLPDDHDVYQGNLWGAGGRPTRSQNLGGYVMPAEWVKMVERTQTSHLPDPHDPTPVQQGIGVYYTAMTYGRISFAIIEDRKFKSGPEGLVPGTGGRSDHVTDPAFDPRTADVPGAKLLGERQLGFLRDWAADWRGADMKAVLSQTVFANVATLHGGGRRRLVADYDSNGWPQTGRNRALHEIRRAFAFMICGDQHLATVVHHGIDGWNDAGWSFCVPSVTNFYPRAWVPLAPGRNREPGMPDYTGEFLDGFGNRITVWAATNPRPMGRQPASVHDKMPGYGIVRFNKKTRRITIECWPRFADPRDPETGGQYEGWPKTIDQLENYGRRALACLPTIEVTGLSDPVVQVVDEANDGVVYTLRIKGTSFRPKVFREASYTVKVGEPGTDRMKVLRNMRPLGPGETGSVRVEF